MSTIADVKTRDKFGLQETKRIDIRREEKENRQEEEDPYQYVVKSGSEYSCEICHKSYRVKHSVSRHVILAHFEAGLDAPCPICHTKLKSRMGLYVHLKQMHQASISMEVLKRYMKPREMAQN